MKNHTRDNAHGGGAAVWITWEHQLRNRSLAARLGVPLHEISLPPARYLRYPLGAARTIQVLLKSRAGTVIAQNPSIALVWLLLLLRPVFRYHLVVDAHFGGVVAYNGSRVFQWAIDRCNRMADLVIVTNAEHAQQIQQLGGRAYVCEDPLPDLSGYGAGQQPDDTKRVFFISSFDVDEPRQALLEAAQSLGAEGFTAQVSGSYHKAAISPENYPSVRLLGFLPESEFYHNLLSAHVVVDLTTNENCLVCGAYEAIAAGVPLVLSDTPAQRAYFRGGTVFTANQPDAIVAAVQEAYKTRAKLVQALKKWRSDANADMDRKILELRRRLGVKVVA